MRRFGKRVFVRREVPVRDGRVMVGRPRLVHVLWCKRGRHHQPWRQGRSGEDSSERSHALPIIVSVCVGRQSQPATSHRRRIHERPKSAPEDSLKFWSECPAGFPTQQSVGGSLQGLYEVTTESTEMRSPGKQSASGSVCSVSLGGRRMKPAIQQSRHYAPPHR